MERNKNVPVIFMYLPTKSISTEADVAVEDRLPTV